MPEVGDIRGRGYFIGIEIVADPGTKKPFDPDRMVHAVIGRRALEKGLICHPCTGNVGGTSGDTIILAPPYNASEEELGELVTTLVGAVREAVLFARGPIRSLTPRLHPCCRTAQI